MRIRIGKFTHSSFITRVERIQIIIIHGTVYYRIVNFIVFLASLHDKRKQWQYMGSDSSVDGHTLDCEA